MIYIYIFVKTIIFGIYELNFAGARIRKKMQLFIISFILRNLHKFSDEKLIEDTDLGVISSWQLLVRFREVGVDQV